LIASRGILRNRMEWREPWRATLADRPPYRFGYAQLRSGLIWSLGLLALVAVSAISPGVEFGEVAGRAWLAFPFGFGLAFLASVIFWLFPGTVGSGPRGIVKDSGGAMLLIPWEAVSTFRIDTNENAKVLTVTTKDGVSHRLLMPVSFPSEQVLAEFREHGVEPSKGQSRDTSHASA
jgi:hypothetical protein